MLSTGTNPVIEIIIVNYNAGDALTRCVQSVFEQNLAVRLTIVDNRSGDDSLASLQESLGSRENMSIIRNDENLGFAKAVNLAAGEMGNSGNHLLILNPDCEMLPGSLAALCQALDDDPGAVLAGPMVVNRDGQVMRGTLRRFPDPWNALLTFSGLWRLGRWFPAFKGVEMDEELPLNTTKVEAVSGACMLLRQPVFIEAGCLDGDYGLHCEDLDLMYRLHQRGYHCIYVPSARVFHEQGVSSSGRPFWVHWQKFRGMQRFFGKFQAAKYMFPLRWMVIAGIWLHFVLTLPLVWFRNRG